MRLNSRWSAMALGLLSTVLAAAAVSAERFPVPEAHPRLLGSRDRLQQLTLERSQAYERVVRVARELDADDHAKMLSLALVCAIEQDEALGRQAVAKAMTYVNGPIRQGHTPFAHDLARCAIVYDLCHEFWTEDQRLRFHTYMNQTVDANVRSETHVFHNGWYGYKHWGIGLACYATYHENDRAAEILQTLEQDWHTRAAPALRMSGAGGGWAEGYYINYWLYEWLFFCEVARHCQGIDYYSHAPEFFQNRALAGLFEVYPGIGIYGSRRSIPMGDGGGRVFGGDRDKALCARRILANYFQDDPVHQMVHAFNDTTPRSSVGVNAYKDLLWQNSSLPRGDVREFPLSHISPGPGYVYARSSWEDDATYFFFKCGDRFTAHQHLDVGHFLIYKYEELVGDGGHYDAFGSRHDVNYHLRSVAHNTVLIHDPQERWPGIRAGAVSGNDGGQAHDWPHHNGAVTDPQQWERDRHLCDIADILAFTDQGDYLYVAGDCTRSYSAHKLERFTRQIVYLRPNTFVILDRVRTTDAHYKKTWLLQAMKIPEQTRDFMVIANGAGRLFVQTLFPADPQVSLISGAQLYTYDDETFPASRDTGPAPECRIEISPGQPSTGDIFLHVLTAAHAETSRVQRARAQLEGDSVTVRLGPVYVAFSLSGTGGMIEVSGHRRELPEMMEEPVSPSNTSISETQP